jgi:hypothetical protein
VSTDATGSFELSVTKRRTIDACEGGVTTEPQFAGQFGRFNNTINKTTTSTVMGTLIGVSPSTVPTCEDSIITSPGVWYTVFGAGARIQAFFNQFQTDFNASVSVYQGSSCSSVELDDSLQYWESF